MILHQEGMTDAQENEAHKVLDLLTTCYPGHPWSVRVMEGICFIRHLEYCASSGGNWGMNIRMCEVDHDAAVFKRKIVMLAGEWLERAGLARGRNVNEDQTDWVEGVPEKFQPAHSRAPLDMDVVVAKDNALREKPRPQVKQLEEENGRKQVA